MEEINNKNSYLLLFSLIYIYVPIIIFVFTWTKLWIAILCLFASSYGLIKTIQSTQAFYGENIKINSSIILIISIYCILIGYCCGWGEFAIQSSDWNKHNAILKDLFYNSWPVYYKNIVKGSNIVEHSMLTYYLGQYIVPSFIGKILQSYKIVILSVYIWNVIGLILIIFNIIFVLNLVDTKKILLMLFLFAFFACPLVLAQLQDGLFISKEFSFNIRWFAPPGRQENERILFQFRGNMACLRWITPQIIVSWLIVTLLFRGLHNVENISFLVIPLVLYSTFSFLGLLPYIVSCCIFKYKEIKRFLSLQNIIILLSLGFVFLLYYYGNALAAKPKDIAFGIISFSIINMFHYFIFVFIMVGLYYICLFKDNKRNYLFHTTFIILALIPIIKMGYFNDFVMNASVPALFVIFLFIIKFINTTKRNIKLYFLMVLLSLGFLYQIQELSPLVTAQHSFKIQGGQNNLNSLSFAANRYDSNVRNDMKYNYFSYDIENNLFHKYIARTK